MLIILTHLFLGIESFNIWEYFGDLKVYPPKLLKDDILFVWDKSLFSVFWKLRFWCW